MMVGSELPEPGHPRVHRDRPRGAARRGPDPRAPRTAAGRFSTDVDLVVHAGEVLGIAGVEGNGQTELVETIMGMRTRRRPDRARRARHHPCEHARAPRGRHRLRPRGPHPHGLLSTQPLWENRILGHQTRPPVARAGPLGLLDLAAARRDTERIVAEFDVRTPGRRGPGRGAVGRQPAEAHRRPGDVRRPGAAHRRPPDPRGRRRCAGRDLGGAPHARGPRGLAVLLISADLDELIGLSDSIAVILRGQARRHGRPGHGHARGARRGHDRRADDGPDRDVPAEPTGETERPPARGVRAGPWPHGPAAARAGGAVRRAAVRGRAADQRRQRR